MRPVALDGVLVAVADGVGGGPAGQEASKIALETLDEAVGTRAPDVAQLAAAVSLANRRIYEVAQRDDTLTGMGTTLTTAVVFPRRLLMAHVGDSRAYQLFSDHWVRLTIDHSVAGEMQAAGGLTEEEAQRHPNRHMLTRVIGPFDRVRVDVTEIPWTDQARLLLCTDGLTTVLDDKDIFDLSGMLSGYALIDALIDQALKRGGPDNITVVLAEDGDARGDSRGR